MTLRLLLADNHEVVRAGLRTWFQATEIEIVGEAASRSEAVRLSLTRRWEVALVDVDMPDGDGLVIAERLRQIQPDSPVVFYADRDTSRLAIRSSALGIAATVLKSSPRETLLTALRAAATFKPSRPRKLNLKPVRGSLQFELLLTERENEVLEQLALGATNREIADTLGISYETVKEHVQHILQKLGVVDRTQAAVWAVRQSLI